jgi:hypothetical protein
LAYSFVCGWYQPNILIGVTILSRLAEFRKAEQDLQERLKQLEKLKNDAGLKKEIEFEAKLQGLMKTYGKSLRDVIAILDPNPAKGGLPSTKPVKTRRARVVKVYQNPHTGELIETKGGNHRGLKAWKEQYGAKTVDAWLRS